MKKIMKKSIQSHDYDQIERAIAGAGTGPTLMSSILERNDMKDVVTARYNNTTGTVQNGSPGGGFSGMTLDRFLELMKRKTRQDFTVPIVRSDGRQVLRGHAVGAPGGAGPGRFGGERSGAARRDMPGSSRATSFAGISPGSLDMRPGAHYA